MFKSMTTNLMVEEVEKTVEFYCEVLEFNVLNSVPNKRGGLQFSILQRDGFNLMIQERVNLIEEYPSIASDRVYPSATLYIGVENIDRMYKKMKEKYEILCDIHKTFYGSDEFAIEDNNGYIITFTEYKSQ